MAQYTYDEQGVTFNYFLLTSLLFVLVPTTFSLFSSKKTETKVWKAACSCEACQRKEQFLRIRSVTQSGGLLSKKMIFVTIGWAFAAYVAYQIATSKVEYQIWDPYQVLGIPEGTPLDEIKRVFKRTSLKYHPDKAPAELKEEYETKFIDITKAYKVLTDDEVRKNYEEWGHPDGKQAYTMGIALPKWIIEAQNNVYVLGTYVIIFGIFMPYYVGRWWYSSNLYTKDRIMSRTMAVFFKGLTTTTTVREVFELISAAAEFKILVEQRPSDEAALKPIVTLISEETERRLNVKYERNKKYTDPYCHKASVLLNAYLLRIKVEDAALQEDQQFIVEKSLHLLNGLLKISQAHNWLSTTLRCMEATQMLVQAMWPEENRLLQLPHVSNEMLKAMKSKKKNVRTVQQLREMTEEERKNTFRSLTSEQYRNVTQAANDYPILDIKETSFSVTGDSVVTPKSIVSFSITLQVKDSSGAKDTAKNDETSKKKKNSTEKEDSKALKGSSSVESAEIDEERSYDYSLFADREVPDFAPVHSPYFPREKKPYWWILIGDEKQNDIIVTPEKVTDLVSSKTYTVQFQAPSQPGLFTYVAFIKSDAFLDADLRKDLKLEVKDMSELPAEPEIDDEISDPEEDSIAGQMKMMREQGLGAALGPSGKGGDSDSDSDDSDSD